MPRRVTQPPVNTSLRDPERHGFFPGVVPVVFAGLLILFGARHATRVESSDGQHATELQLIKAFASGGLQATEAFSVPDPSSYRDPAAAAAALERLAREQRGSFPIKYRVNTAAADPCPT